MTVDDLDTLKHEYFHCPTCRMPPYHGATERCLKCGTAFEMRTLTTLGLMEYAANLGYKSGYTLAKSRIEKYLGISGFGRKHDTSMPFGSQNYQTCPTQTAKDLIEAWRARHGNPVRHDREYRVE